MTRFTGIAALAVFAATHAAGAQVGYEPGRSPYRDLERSHELTVYSGAYRAHPDAARVAPQSGAMLGLRYQWLAGGAANLTAEVSRVASQRRVLDPDLPKCLTGDPNDCKLISTFRWPLYFADIGVALNLTGSRSYRHLVPEVRGGLGLVSDFHTRGDVGDFSFGTRFAVTWGGGIRWVVAGPLQLRFDLTNRLYKVRYPASYYSLAPDTSRILVPILNKRSAWMNNAALTIGASFLFGR